MSILWLLLLGLNVYFLVGSWKRKDYFWMAVNVAMIVWMLSSFLFRC